MAAANQLRGLREEASCSICLEYFTDPVCVECGHVFCLSCITQYWEGLQRDFPCPQCRVSSKNKTLRPIRHLGNMVELLKQLHAPSAIVQGENLCREHEEKLKLFCEDDQKPICLVCSTSRDHKSHTVLPILEAAQEYKETLHTHVERLKKELENLQASEAEQRRTVSELQESFKNHSKKILNTSELLKQFLEKEKQQLLSKLEKEHEEKMRKIQEKLSKLEKQQSAHRDLIKEIEGKCQQQDVELLKDVQIILSRCDSAKVRKSEEDAVMDQTLQSIGQYASSQDKRLEVIATIPLELEWRYIKACATAVTLDPDTVHRTFVLSEDGRSLRHRDRARNPPGCPWAFIMFNIVLGRERWSSGRHYWEVEVGDKTSWALGVCDGAVSRKGESTNIDGNRYWTVWLLNGVYKDNTIGFTTLTPRVPPRAVGLFLDYEAGRLSVYNADDRSLLSNFSRASFPPTLRPYFSPGLNDEGRNAGALRVRSVTGRE